MNSSYLLKIAGSKSNFPSLKSIYKRTPIVFFLVLISFFVARPIAIFGIIPASEHWKLCIGYAIIAIFCQVSLWFMIDKFLPDDYKKDNWTKGKSLMVKFIFALIILSFFHFYTKLLGYHSSLDFFLGIGLPLSIFPAFFYILLESTMPLKKNKEILADNTLKPNLLEENTSDFLFAETHAAFMKRWNIREIRRNELYGYYEAENKKTEDILIRGSDTIEDFVRKCDEPIFHCHKSYCINPSKIIVGIGNSKKFSIIIGTKNYEVPVSREKTEEIILLLKQQKIEVLTSLDAYPLTIIPVWQTATHLAKSL